MSLPTQGRILLETTAGDIEIELWSKESPRACRNLIALAMEGYYDGVVFHRIVPNFLVQTGDRTGTGGGGESFYGEPFEDEIHPRLRFPHRGIVASANNGTKDSNDSQFFITLDRAEELHGTHTVIGKTIGDSIFNVLKIGASELGEDGRPIYPPKIKTIRILDNPFDDIVPRITAEEKRAQQRAREETQRERELESKRSKKSNPKLLSFGMDEEEGASAPIPFKKRDMARPDLASNPEAAIWDVPDPIVSKATEKRRGEASTTANAPALSEKKAKPKADKETAASVARRAEIEKMEADIRKLTRPRGDSDSEDESNRTKAKGPSLLEQQLSKYSVGKPQATKGGKQKGGSNLVAQLNSFRGLLKSTALRPGDEEQEVTSPKDAPVAEGEEEGIGIEVDYDSEWMSHSLSFPKGNEEEVAKAEREYEVIDPRARATRAREEEKERKAREQQGKKRKRW